ncbi:MAG: hypothetical protein KKA81_08790 [Bacteroidetes bacterium]|nr:hypothetical protein [Bacteroidota bacterium]
MEKITDLWDFMRTRKKFWLLPAISLILMAGILGLLYIFIVTPIAWLQCFLMQNPLKRTQMDNASYLVVRNHVYKPSDFVKPW